MGTLYQIPYMGTTQPSALTLHEFGFKAKGADVGCFGASNYAVCVGQIRNGNTVYISYGVMYIAYARFGSDTSESDLRTNAYSVTSPAGTIYYNSNIISNWVYYVESPDPFDSVADIITAFYESSPPEGSLNISYSIQNGSVVGPTWTSPGAGVTAYVTIKPGFSLTQQDITITRNGVSIPFTYANGTLTFTSPS